MSGRRSRPTTTLPVLFLVLLGLSCTLLAVTTVSADEGEDQGAGFSAQGMSGSSSEDPTSTTAPEISDSTTQPTPEGSSDAPPPPPPDTSDPSTTVEPAQGSEGSTDDGQGQQQKPEKVSVTGLRNSPDSIWPKESQPARAGSQDIKTNEKPGAGEAKKSDDAAAPVESAPAVSASGSSSSSAPTTPNNSSSPAPAGSGKPSGKRRSGGGGDYDGREDHYGKKSSRGKKGYSRQHSKDGYGGGKSEYNNDYEKPREPSYSNGGDDSSYGNSDYKQQDGYGGGESYSGGGGYGEGRNEYSQQSGEYGRPEPSYGGEYGGEEERRGYDEGRDYGEKRPSYESNGYGGEREEYGSGGYGGPEKEYGGGKYERKGGYGKKKGSSYNQPSQSGGYGKQQQSYNGGGGHQSQPQQSYSTPSTPTYQRSQPSTPSQPQYEESPLQNYYSAPYYNGEDSHYCSVFGQFSLAHSPNYNGGEISEHSYPANKRRSSSTTTITSTNTSTTVITTVGNNTSTSNSSASTVNTNFVSSGKRRSHGGMEGYQPQQQQPQQQQPQQQPQQQSSPRKSFYTRPQRYHTRQYCRFSAASSRRSCNFCCRVVARSASNSRDEITGLILAFDPNNPSGESSKTGKEDYGSVGYGGGDRYGGRPAYQCVCCAPKASSYYNGDDSGAGYY